MKKLRFIAIFLLVFIGYKILFNPPANPEVRQKLSLIDKKLKQNGYKTRYFVSSGKRSVWYNNMLKTTKKSYHLQGKAIDIIVFDIDGDWDFDEKDISIVYKYAREVDKQYPKLKGGFGTYRKEGGIYSNMIHIDTRGHIVRYYY